MIITDEKITTNNVVLRFYFYSDTEKGYGDDGTYCYKKVPTSMLKEEKKQRFNKSFYYIYRLDAEYGKSLLKNNYWWIDYGVELSDEKEKLKEIKRLEKRIANLKS
jgi:hypothetical protein